MATKAKAKSGSKKSTKESSPKKKSADLKVEVKKIPKRTQEVPKEKVVYVEVDEEVTAVIDRLKHLPNKAVILVIPKRSVLLQSVINLKLLKTQIKKQSKEIAIVTSDKKGNTLASQVGLTVYQDLKSRGMETEVDEQEEVSVVKTPVKAQINHQEEKPVLKQGKKSLTDLLRGKSESFYNRLGRNRIEKLYRKPESPSGKEKIDTGSFLMNSPSRRLLGFFLGASLFALLAIMIFILPNAVIYVRPEVKIEKPLVRIVLADQASFEAELKVKTDNVVASNPIETDIEMTKTYSATGQSAAGLDAQGTITVYNESAANQLLIKTTRFRAPNGVIFRIQNDVTVPANGNTTAYVVADTLDENGDVAGEKANIEAGTKLDVPGLQGENKGKVYGMNEEAFTNGTTEPVSVVTEADLEAAKTQIVEELTNSVRGKLIERINADNVARGLNLALLSSDTALKTKIIEVKVLDDVKPNQVSKNFKVYAKTHVTGTTFDKNEVVEILDRELNKVLHPDMYLADTDFDSLALQYVGEDGSAKRIKVNASMAYKLEYSLDDDLKAKIIEHVLGKGLQSSEEYIQGLEEVSEAKISTWPFWVRKIPGIASNVKVEKLAD
ncbi:MAG: hypothetical protein PHU71_05835 [Candidatus Gracilibacteria bacterium]|nr:hypothetical protein [Candidatus Gracilibacteria bacterium]